MPWLAILAFAKRVGTGVITWLSHRSFWQLVSMALLALLVFSHFQTVAERRHSAKVERQLSKALAQLESISIKRDTQKVVTRTNIVTATKILHDAQGRAEIVEKAPPAPNCRTKKEILDADL